MTVTIGQALVDKKLLGAALGDPKSHGLFGSRR